MPKRIVAVVGSYRKKGVIHQTVTVLLDAAKARGASVEKIDLLDKRVAFCKNCRTCAQSDPQSSRGKCVQRDDMSKILDAIERADGLILASPINVYTITAIMKRFVERLTVYSYWPWGGHQPKMRKRSKTKSAIVVTSSAAPAPVARLFFGSGIKILKSMAKVLGAERVKVLHIGLAGSAPDQKLSPGQIKKARLAARALL